MLNNIFTYIRDLKMDSMKELKEWIVTKCRLNMGNLPILGASPPCRSAVPLTPKNIPEFVIPGSGESSRRASSEIMGGDGELLACIPTVRSYSIPTSAHNSPSHSRFGSASCLTLPTNYPHCMSAPVSPKTEHKYVMCTVNTHSMNYIDTLNKDTNADPLSVAAMSLPHFRTNTAFGFTTLKEIPHTRRKESLFHIESDTLLLPQYSKRRINSIEPKEVLSDVTKISDIDICLYKDAKFDAPSVIITPHNQSEKDIDMNGMDNDMNPDDVSALIRRQTRYYRRRSSLGVQNGEREHQEDSVDNIDLANMSPDSKRRATSTLSPNVLTTQKRHSSPQLETERNTGTIEMVLDSKPRSCSCHNISKVNINPHAKFGELKFAFQYLANSKQLKVLLMRAENIGGPSRQDQHTNTFAKVYLMPGKLQKHASDIVKHTRNPVFNREFYFQDLELEQLHTMTLRIKIFHKSHNLRLPELIGEINVALDSYDLLAENRMWKDLESKRETEDLGFLEISMKFEPKEGLLYVMVVQAKGLPERHITGAPDPYVRMEMSQPNRTTYRKQTRTRKNTLNPMLKETFSFTISPKLEDLKYTTLTFTVYAHDRVRSDEAIGQVRFGYGTTEPTTYQQWNDIQTCPGRDITSWHYLIDSDDNNK